MLISRPALSTWGIWHVAGRPGELVLPLAWGVAGSYEPVLPKDLQDAEGETP